MSRADYSTDGGRGISLVLGRKSRADACRVVVVYTQKRATKLSRISLTRPAAHGTIRLSPRFDSEGYSCAFGIC
jgi:hypothetical protein